MLLQSSVIIKNVPESRVEPKSSWIPKRTQKERNQKQRISKLARAEAKTKRANAKKKNGENKKGRIDFALFSSLWRQISWFCFPSDVHFNFRPFYFRLKKAKTKKNRIERTANFKMGENKERKCWFFFSLSTFALLVLAFFSLFFLSHFWPFAYDIRLFWFRPF